MNNKKTEFDSHILYINPYKKFIDSFNLMEAQDFFKTNPISIHIRKTSIDIFKYPNFLKYCTLEVNHPETQEKIETFFEEIKDYPNNKNILEYQFFYETLNPLIEESGKQKFITNQNDLPENIIDSLNYDSLQLKKLTTLIKNFSLFFEESIFLNVNSIKSEYYSTTKSGSIKRFFEKENFSILLPYKIDVKTVEKLTNNRVYLFHNIFSKNQKLTAHEKLKIKKYLNSCGFEEF